MNKWDWIRSAVIFVMGVFILNNFFISLTLIESIILMIFVAAAVFHTIDVHHDLHKRLASYRRRRDENGG